MRLPWMTAALALGLMARTPDPRPADLMVYVIPEGPATISQAKSLATSMFATAGVRVAWRYGEPAGRQPGVLTLAVRLARAVRPCYVPDALGCAYPYASADRAIVVFLDQVQLDARSTSTPEYILLAHVLVHEITHVLEGVDRHAQSGVMKARFTKSDKYAMMSGPLPFEPQDLQMIRAGLDSRRPTPSPARIGGFQ